MDSKRAKRIQDGEVVNLHPYTGNNSSVLRTMTEVELAHLEVGHSFSDKDVLILQIAEEANLRGIKIRIVRSDNSNIHKTGDSFNVCATFLELKGWVVAQCDIANNKEVRDSDNEVKIVTKPRSPFGYKMIATLIKTTIATKSYSSNQSLRQLLSMFGKEYAMTDNLIQQARTYAKAKKIW